MVVERDGLSFTIAKNITELRRAHGMTQAILAEKLDYSDKSVSKWERAEGLPDVICLKKIADLFGVSVDYLLSDDHDENVVPGGDLLRPQKTSEYVTNKRAVVLLSIVGVWLLAALTYIITLLCDCALPLIFVIALPVTALLAVIFNAMWGKRSFDFYAVSALVWTILFLICFIFREYGTWLLMVLGIPATLIVWLSCRVKVKKKDINVE